MQSLLKVNIYLGSNLTIPLLCIYLRDKKIYVFKKTWIDVHGRNLDWSRYPFIGHWLNSRSYAYMMECYSVMKRNGMLIYPKHE